MVRFEYASRLDSGTYHRMTLTAVLLYTASPGSMPLRRRIRAPLRTRRHRSAARPDGHARLRADLRSLLCVAISETHRLSGSRVGLVATRRTDRVGMVMVTVSPPGVEAFSLPTTSPRCRSALSDDRSALRLCHRYTGSEANRARGRSRRRRRAASPSWTFKCRARSNPDRRGRASTAAARRTRSVR